MQGSKRLLAERLVEAIVTEKAKLVYKQEAATRKIAKEWAMQQKKAAREAQALLDTQWNVEYSAAEAAWRIERDQARAENRKPPKTPLKPLRPRVVDMGVQRVWKVRGERSVWRMWRVKSVKSVKRVRRI